MNKKRMFIRRITSFICVFFLISSVFTNDSVVSAAESFEQFITGVKITDMSGHQYSKDNPAKPGDKIKIYFDYTISSAQRNNMINHGYTDVVYQYKCPDEIYDLIKREGIMNAGTWKEITDANGNKFKFRVTSDGIVEVTFMELKKGGEIGGSVWLESAINKDADKKIDNIEFTVNSKPVKVPLYLEPAVSCDLQKKGTINNVTNKIDWDITVSPKYDTDSLAGITITDVINTDHQQITDGTKVYCDGKEIAVSFSKDNGITNGFTYLFPDGEPAGKKHITYSTTFKDEVFKTAGQWIVCDNTVTAEKNKKTTNPVKATINFSSNLIQKSHTNDGVIDKDGNVVVDYRIDLDNVGINIGDDVILKDTLPEGTEYVDGSLKVLDESNTAKSGVTVSKDVSDSKVININMGKVDKKYIITYQIKYNPKKMDFSNGKKYKNKVSVDYNGTTHSSEADLPQKSVSGSGVTIKKGGELLYGDRLSNIISDYKIKDEDIGNMVLWTIKIGENGKKYTKGETFKFIDNIPAGLEYIDGTLKYSGGTVSNINYSKPVVDSNGSIKWDTTPLTCDIASPINGGAEITFLTKFVQFAEGEKGVRFNGSGWGYPNYKNTASLDGSTSDATVQIITKNRISKTGKYNLQTKKFSWTVDYNSNSDTQWQDAYLLKNPRLKEVLPAGHKLSMVNGRYDVYAEEVKTGKKTQVGTEESPWKIDYDELTGIAEISWKNTNAKNYITSRYKFYINSELEDDSMQKKAFDNGQDVSSTNTVYYYADNIKTDDKYNMANSTVNIKKKDIMSKSDDNYKSGNDVPWKIIVNQNYDKSIMKGAVIRDKLQTGLLLDTASVKVYEAEYNSNSDSFNEGKEVTKDGFIKIKYNSSDNQMAIEFGDDVPEGKAYIIKFTTIINDKNTTTINNSADFSGHDGKNASAASRNFSFVQDGIFHSTVLSLNVEKYGYNNAKLAGAKFKLTETGVVDGDSYTNTTDETGNTQFLKCLMPDETYRLEELTAPKGYYIINTPIDFIAGDELLNNNIKVYDVARGVRLKKTNKSGDMLPGAEFALYKSDGTEITGFTKTKDSDGTLVYWYDGNGSDKLISDSTGMIRVKGLDAGKFYFKEVTAPDGYVKSEEEYNFELLEKLDPSKLNDNYVDVSAVNIKDKPKTVDFSFTKINKDDEALSCAEFKLYKKICKDSSHHHDSMNDDMNNTSCWSFIDTKESKSDGKVDFAALENGASYRLIETKAPDGYRLPGGCWNVDISSDGEITITGVDIPTAFEKKDGVYKLVNYKKTELPLMGGSGRYPYIVFGIMILMCGACVYVLRKKCVK